MKQPQEQILNKDELKKLAKFLDVLMEADFEINRNEGVVVNAN